MATNLFRAFLNTREQSNGSESVLFAKLPIGANYSLLVTASEKGGIMSSKKGPKLSDFDTVEIAMRSEIRDSIIPLKDVGCQDERWSYLFDDLGVAGYIPLEEVENIYSDLLDGLG